MNPYTRINTKGETIETIPSLKPRAAIEYEREYYINEVSDAIIYVMHTSTYRTEIVKQINKPITEHCYYVDNEYILYSLPYIRTVMALDYVVYRYLFGTFEQSVNPKNLICRRNEWLQVTKDAIKFYYLCDKDSNAFEMIHKRVLGVVKVQYLIYFRMKDLNVGKQELLQFDKYLREECPDLYSDLITRGRWRSVLFFRLLRKTNFRLFSLVAVLLHAIE